MRAKRFLRGNGTDLQVGHLDFEFSWNLVYISLHNAVSLFAGLAFVYCCPLVITCGKMWFFLSLSLIGLCDSCRYQVLWKK